MKFPPMTGEHLTTIVVSLGTLLLGGFARGFWDFLRGRRKDAHSEELDDIERLRTLLNEMERIQDDFSAKQSEWLEERRTLHDLLLDQQKAIAALERTNEELVSKNEALTELVSKVRSEIDHRSESCSTPTS